jgi:DNA-binding NarL/FixJ family response regulator
MGELDQAATHFEQGLAFCRKAAYRPELAWTCCDYADTLLHRNEPGDHKRAMSLLDESLAISTELGMRPLMERVTNLQQQVKSPPGRTSEYPAGLTSREVEVLRLIASGKRNPQIAEELYISSKTVGNHVSSILKKTSTSNRSEAAAYAVRRGLA